MSNKPFNFISSKNETLSAESRETALRAENERLRKALGWAMRRIDKYARHRAEEGDSELYEFVSALSELDY